MCACGDAADDELYRRCDRLGTVDWKFPSDIHDWFVGVTAMQRMCDLLLVLHLCSLLVEQFCNPNNRRQFTATSCPRLDYTDIPGIPKMKLDTISTGLNESISWELRPSANSTRLMR